MLTITNLLFSLSQFQLLKMYYSMVKILNSINHIRHQLYLFPPEKLTSMIWYIQQWSTMRDTEPLLKITRLDCVV